MPTYRVGGLMVHIKMTNTKKRPAPAPCVAWTPELRAVVERAKALQGSVRCLSLLKGRSNKPPTYRTVVGQWWLACKAAGVEDVTLHDLRAKSLTDAKQQGKDATALAGHADAKMTERYLRLRETPVVYGPSIRQLLDVGQAK